MRTEEDIREMIGNLSIALSHEDSEDVRKHFKAVIGSLSWVVEDRDLLPTPPKKKDA